MRASAWWCANRIFLVGSAYNYVETQPCGRAHMRTKSRLSSDPLPRALSKHTTLSHVNHTQHSRGLPSLPLCIIVKTAPSPPNPSSNRGSVARRGSVVCEGRG